MKKNKKVLKFKLNTFTEIPKELVKNCPKSGPCDDYIENALLEYEIDVSLKDSQKYLKLFGAWELKELKDLEENKKRLLWLAILDCKENKEFSFYMGE
jgi:hypothetical protein